MESITEADLYVRWDGDCIKAMVLETGNRNIKYLIRKIKSGLKVLVTRKELDKIEEILEKEDIFVKSLLHEPCGYYFPNGYWSSPNYKFAAFL